MLLSPLRSAYRGERGRGEGGERREERGRERGREGGREGGRREGGRREERGREGGRKGGREEGRKDYIVTSNQMHQIQTHTLTKVGRLVEVS